MKRFAWLLLLVSLGLNLGLGWRLINEQRKSSDGSERTWRHDGRGQRSDRISGQSRRGGAGSDRRGPFRPAAGDSSAWRELMNMRLKRITDKLDLNSDQVATFRETHFDAMTRFRRLRERVEAGEEKLFSLANADPMQPDSVRAAVMEMGACRASLDSLITETMLKELDTLDAQQREIYLRILPWSRLGIGLEGPPSRGHKGKPGSGRNLPGNNPG